MTLPRRMLDLDISSSRAIAREIWNEKRSTVFSDQAIYDQLIAMEERVNASGAYRRDAERWYGEAQELDLSEMIYYATDRAEKIEAYLTYMWPVEGEQGE